MLGLGLLGLLAGINGWGINGLSCRLARIGGEMGNGL